MSTDLQSLFFEPADRYVRDSRQDILRRSQRFDLQSVIVYSDFRPFPSSEDCCLIVDWTPQIQNIIVTFLYYQLKRSFLRGVYVAYVRPSTSPWDLETRTARENTRYGWRALRILRLCLQTTFGFLDVADLAHSKDTMIYFGIL
jgi:hypothetical protein